jgi:hypothetical protein
LILFVKNDHDGDRPARSFYCKFQGLSHLHNAWLFERRVKRLSDTKLKNFLAKYEQKDDDDLDQDKEKYAEWEKVERIIAERSAFTLPPQVCSN